MIKLIAFDLDNTLYDERTSQLYDGVSQLLTDAYKQYSLALITNGSKKNQEKKVKNIKHLFRYIYYVGFIERHKPDPWVFKELIKKSKLSHKEIVHIGDNPFTDFIPCKLCNIFSIRVNTHEYKDRIVDPFLDANLIVNDVAEALEFLLGRKEL